MVAAKEDIMEDTLKQLIENSEVLQNPVSDENAWIEVIQRMDSIYADLVRYQVELEKKNASLEEAHNFIESVMSSMSDVLIVADIHGQIQRVNQALLELTQRPAETITNQPLSTLFMPEYAAMVEDFAEHIRSNEINDCEVELIDSNGDPTPIAINCSARFDHDGRLSGLVITGRPLGELQRAYQDLQETHDQLKTTQQQLVHSEKMASLGQLVAGVAHELNNPISFVFGNMHALKRYEKRLAEYILAIHDGKSKAQREQLREDLKIDRLLQDIGPLIDGSLEGAERVSQIVEDLRRFSTPNQQERANFDLIRVINTAADWVVKARRERPYLQIDLPDEFNLVGYEGYVHQILVNLIQNAADAVEGNKEPSVAISLEAHHGQIHIQVRDNGKGISQDKLMRIFDPFFTTKPVGKGTGLGLYISYNLATDQCRGELTASNHPDGGAQFTLSLPLGEPQ
jgi:two-component system sensor histidine kinase HupT/HoxJ